MLWVIVFELAAAERRCISLYFCITGLAHIISYNKYYSEMYETAKKMKYDS